jgi:pimeloyl-ACP methyl ester carboxylesterase
MRSAPARLTSGTRKVLKAAAGGVLMAAAVGAAYQVLASWNDRRSYFPPGRLVDIGGHALHVREMGEGSPTVVLEAGLTATSAIWGWIQPALAAVTRVIAYDRSGIGWSDENAEPHDAGTVAQHLGALLDRLAIDGPVVLVGHSMGGLYVRVFADLFPKRAAGLVLVDPAHPDQLEHFSAEGVRLQRTFMGQLRVAPILAGFGVLRMSGEDILDGAKDLPEESRIDAEVFYSSIHHLTGVKEEMLAWDESAAQVRRTRVLGDRPLIVLSATEGPEALVSTLPSLHAEMARLSNRGEHRFVEGASHRTILTREEHAQVTAAAILDLVESVRAG